MTTLKELIRKYCVKNAYDYGKVSVQSVLGKLLAEKPELKSQIKEIIPLIREEAKDVERLNKDQLAAELKSYDFTVKRREEPVITQPVVVRFAPEPAGRLHIGHAKALFLNDALRQKHGGKLILRFDDTNPQKVSADYVKFIEEDIKWLGVEVDEVSFTSDFIPQMYEVVEEMLREGSAYVCTCSPDTIKRNRELKKECECRKRDVNENLALFQQLKSGDLQAVVRLKADMKSENTAMRDPTLFRLNFNTHFRQGNKYVLWPTYDFAVVFMDYREGITHVLRSKEYELRNAVYDLLCKAMHIKTPNLITFSRLKMRGQVVGKRYIQPLIEQGKVDGWCDLRLVTLCALRERGIPPQAIKDYVLSFGWSLSDNEGDWEKFARFVRQRLSHAPHFFAVEEPVMFRLDNEHEIVVDVSAKSNIERVLKVKPRATVYLSKNDVALLKDGEMFRLKDLVSVVKEGNTLHVVDGFSPKMKKVNWVSQGKEVSFVYVKPLFVDGRFNVNSKEYKPALVEQLVFEKKVDVVQFERLGFYKRLDDKHFVFIA